MITYNLNDAISEMRMGKRVVGVQATEHGRRAMLQAIAKVAVDCTLYHDAHLVQSPTGGLFYVALNGDKERVLAFTFDLGYNISQNESTILSRIR